MHEMHNILCDRLGEGESPLPSLSNLETLSEKIPPLRSFVTHKRPHAPSNRLNYAAHHNILSKQMQIMYNVHVTCATFRSISLRGFH